MLLHSQPYGTIFTSTWLIRKGYSYALQQRYRFGANPYSFNFDSDYEYVS